MFASDIPWTAVYQAPLSMEFSRKEYWSGLPFPPPGDLIDPGIKPEFSVSPALEGGYFTTETLLVVSQLLSRVWLFATPWTAALKASLTFTISQSLLKLMSIDSMMPSNHLIICGPLLLLPSIFPSIRVFPVSWLFASDGQSVGASASTSGSFPMNWFFALGGQNVGASASASGLSMNIQDWFPLGLTGLISLQSTGFSRVFSNNTVLLQHHQFFGTQPSLWSNSHILTWPLEKP